MTFVARCLLLAAVAVTTVAAVPAYAQSPSAPLQLLDVPYVPQSEVLCGGAAAAMVMRFWGATGVYAEDFESLVDRAAGGIRGGDLVAALRAKGWLAASTSADAAAVHTALRQRIPPVALIEDRPGRFHYVVIVGWAGGRVMVHDPARAPFRLMSEAAFLRAWSESGNWTMTLTPDPNRPASAAKVADAAALTSATPGVCGAEVDEGIRLANGGALDEARTVLEGATTRCRTEPAAWRELAGVFAIRKDWTRAAAHAREALARDARDEHAARILATSLFLEGNDDAALRTWNTLGEPTIDLVEVRGLERTRFAVVAGTLGLQPRQALTVDVLARARRRLAALPAGQGSRVFYAPRENGLATVTAVVIERPLFPSTPLLLASQGIAALTDRGVRLNLASPTGGGELISAAWRWWEHRPRVSLGFASPAPFGGTWGITAFDERQTYGLAGAEQEERRRRVAFDVGDWVRGDLQWQGAVALDRWDAGATASFSGAVQYRRLDDRVALGVSAGAWTAPLRAWSSSVAIDWRSRTRHEGSVWLARAGAASASARTPMALWPGAGTGQGRTELLRAHPLLDDGIVRDGVFGRRLVHTSGEWRRWSAPRFKVLRFAPALFADVARALDVPPFGDGRAQVDVGAGLRIAIPGAGVLRADLAKGLRDGATALSFGWTY